MAGFIPNLHITTEGDAAVALTWVPYGKQLVLEMMRSGLPYMTRTQHVSDLVEVVAQVAGEQRYLHIKAGGCSLYMDSGIVHMRSVAPSGDERYRNGIIHYSDVLDAHVAQERLVGRLKNPSTLESIPPVELNDAPSFSAPEVADQASLYLKKLAAAQCPASIFTGKLRLFVQALYGAPLAAFKNWQWVPHGISAAPYLQYLGNAPTLTLDTNSGVLTTTDGRYYIMLMQQDSITVRRLQLSTCGQTLATKVADGTIVAPEADIAEAYALSTGKPSASEWFSVPITGAPAPSGWMLGYGWHWNWDGTAADIIDTQTGVTHPLGGYQYRSTHYRISITRDGSILDQPGLTPKQNEERRWSAVCSVVEGPKDWKIHKWGEVIAFPEWSSPVLTIFGNLLGEPIACDAPFYCFYRRNTLQVVRASRSGGTLGTYYEIVSEPHYFWGGTMAPRTTDRTWGLCSSFTVGDEAAFSEHRVHTNEPITTSFLVNGAGASIRDATYSYDALRSLKKEWSAVLDTYLPGDLPPQDPGPVTKVRVGPPLSGVDYSPIGCYASSGNAVYETVDVANPLGYFGQCNITVHHEQQSVSGNTVKTGKMLCVVPYYDAEAVYLWSQDTDVFSESGTTQTFDSTGSIGLAGISVSAFSNHPGQLFTYFYFEDFARFGWVNGPGINTGTQTAFTDTHSSMYSSAGVFTWQKENALADFFAGEAGGGTVSQFFDTRGSVAGNVAGHGIPVTGGYPSGLFDSTPAVFVGGG